MQSLLRHADIWTAIGNDLCIDLLQNKMFSDLFADDFGKSAINERIFCYKDWNDRRATTKLCINEMKIFIYTEFMRLFAAFVSAFCFCSGTFRFMKPA